ncbi:Sec-independent protein translocase protein TatB [uncultured Lentibacter sp.]|jgi:sec-independent protein translocase protein TatB|uniref:Sec-independent protein translocase protein TatB n=1 Tax=uncultured Lentibacter sp. TaxID=1659309 RepID=UPI0026272562|nr:Sec-independent protein translocase protein TatB [uncultured Lentibacter sp.]
MFDLGWTELLVIGIVALIVVGPKDLPVLFRKAGEFVGKMKGMAREFSKAMNDAADETGMRETASSLRKVADPKSMGLDSIKDAVKDAAKWDPESETGKLAAKREAERARMVEEANASAAETARQVREAHAARLAKEAEPAETAKKPAPRKPAAKKPAAKPAAKKPAAKPAAKTPAAQKGPANTGSKPSATQTTAPKPAPKKATPKKTAAKKPAPDKA